MFKSVCALTLALMLAGLTSPLITAGGQLAIWVTDERGAFVDTVYGTGCMAKKGLGNRKGGLNAK